jgi:shikimate kinase
LAEHILLIGMMGAGKTTVGTLLAQRLGRPYVDSDDQVAAATGRTVREIFESDGEAAFRREEAAALAHALDQAEPSVIAVAGGAVLDPANRARMQQRGTVVWLRAPVDVLADRARHGGHRPLLDGDTRVAMAKLYEGREPIYESLADLTVEVGDRTPEQAAEEILEALP